MKVRIVTSKGSWTCATTGKGRFIQRLIPALNELGVEVTEDANNPADVDLGVGKWVYKPKRVKKLVVRMGPSHFDKSQDWKSLNKRKTKAVKKSDGVIYQSEWCKEVGHKFLVPHSNETVIFNGAPIVTHKVFPKNPVFIAATRKWIPQKRLGSLIEAFFDAQIDNSKFIIFGEIPGRELTRSVRGIKSIIHKGLRAPEEIQDYMREATAFLHPVWLDGCPNAVVEALACGLPVICGCEGGTYEIVQDNGYTCIDDEWDFGPKNLNKPPKLEAIAWVNLMRAAAKMKIEIKNSHIDIKNIAKQYVEFFQKVLNG